VTVVVLVSAIAVAERESGKEVDAHPGIKNPSSRTASAARNDGLPRRARPRGFAPSPATL